MPKTMRRVLKMTALLGVILLSGVCAGLLRFDFHPRSTPWIWIAMGIAVVVKGPIFWASRLHAGDWRTASLFDLHRVALANIAASGLGALIIAVTIGTAFPRSLYILDAILCFLFTATLIFSLRLYQDIFSVPPSVETRRVLIYGAGVAGYSLGREILSQPDGKTAILGFLDDDQSRHNTLLLGLEILGTGAAAKDLVERFAEIRRPVSEIIIAIPSATGREMQAVTAHCRAAGVPFRTLPSIAELLDGKMTRQIREVSPNDLLGREPVNIDSERISAAIAGESVMVTGGAGSIGSELCRQLAPYSPRKLVIFDQAESEMYMLALDLRKRHPQLNLVTEVGDIFRASRITQAMAVHEVTVVFHAAAYKHVPLMEENVVEAVENNIIGTYNVARAACENRVSKFVLISSDKAVNPTSVMGLTKRVAELIVSVMPLDGIAEAGTFVSVRFGNVLGSSGSVIPIFRKQIAAGGPLTVTDPEMRRYFMSISEAVQLVLQASTMGDGSEIFVLDMGEPVPIMTLARNMIRLAGLVEGQDIEIAVTGLRPGEKLFEELQLDDENVLPTYHEKIRRFRGPVPSSRLLSEWLETLHVLLSTKNVPLLKAHLKQLVPEYRGEVPEMADEQAHQLAAAAEVS